MAIQSSPLSRLEWVGRSVEKVDFFYLAGPEIKNTRIIKFILFAASWAHLHSNWNNVYFTVYLCPYVCICYLVIHTLFQICATVILLKECFTIFCYKYFTMRTNFFSESLKCTLFSP